MLAKKLKMVSLMSAKPCRMFSFDYNAIEEPVIALKDE
jgi:hypothetical protein